MRRFGDRLSESLEKRGPLCVGIDPHPALLDRWGLPVTAAGLERFASTIVDALADRVAVLKPQSAFFERFGSAGIAVLESTIRHSRAAGAIVLLDVKRGDIGTTMQAYAEAYLNPASPLFTDAITVSPYLGFGSLAPAFDQAQAHGGGVFVLARTSNPEGGEVQLARDADGRSVAQGVVDQVARLNDRVSPLGDVGLVIGATAGGASADLGLELGAVNGPVLAPGLGAQGAGAADLRIFDGLRGVVLPSWSREVLAHGPSVTGVREAAARALDACRKVLEYPI